MFRIYRYILQKAKPIASDLAQRTWLFKMKWSPTGKPVVPTKVPVFAFGYDAVIRLRQDFGATSRRSILIVCAFIHGQARGLLRRRIKSWNDFMAWPSEPSCGRRYPEKPKKNLRLGAQWWFLPESRFPVRIPILYTACQTLGHLGAQLLTVEPAVYIS